MAADDTWLTTSQAAVAMGHSRYDSRVQGELRERIRAGTLRGELVNGRYRIDPDSLEPIVAARLGVRSLTDAGDTIARLRAEIDQLKAAARDLASAGHVAAEDALLALSLDESLAILSRIETEGWSYHERTKVYDAGRVIQHQLDLEAAPASRGKRPPRVPDRAQHRTLTTGVGPIDIWYWIVKRGVASAYGGPRPRSAGIWSSPREALKRAGEQARYVYGRPSRSTSIRLRFAVLARDQFTCQYCGRKAPDVELHVDHVIPVAEAGSNALDNLVTACRDCNLGKHSLVIEPSE